MKAKRNTSIILLLIIITMIGHITVNAVLIYNNPATSFPWWSAFLFTGIYYYPLIIISLVVYVVFCIKAKKPARQNKRQAKIE